MGNITQQPAGRFAPSPTGEPHFGTLLAAVASYVHARATGARWLVRVEDLDQTREVPGAADQMLRTLEKFGLHWDGEIIYQSSRTGAYQELLDSLLERQLAFPCGCSRKDFIAGKYGPEGPVYPGICRNGIKNSRPVRSYRMKVHSGEICFEDIVQGRLCQNLATEIGDFIIKRADGYFAYQLAAVADDAWQGITQVVRGADLLGSTQRQIFLQQQLGYPTPEYLHIPLILGPDGKKLSKSEHSPPVDTNHPEKIINTALKVLGQQPPDDLTAAELLEWANAQWQAEMIPAVNSLPYALIEE